MRCCKGKCVSEGHLGCVRLACVTLVVAIGEDSLIMIAEINYIPPGHVL
jgi:hypothetical protein